MPTYADGEGQFDPWTPLPTGGWETPATPTNMTPEEEDAHFRGQYSQDEMDHLQGHYAAEIEDARKRQEEYYRERDKSAKEVKDKEK